MATLPDSSGFADELEGENGAVSLLVSGITGPATLEWEDRFTGDGI